MSRSFFVKLRSLSSVTRCYRIIIDQSSPAQASCVQQPLEIAATSIPRCQRIQLRDPPRTNRTSPMKFEFTFRICWSVAERSFPPPSLSPSPSSSPSPSPSPPALPLLLISSGDDIGSLRGCSVENLILFEVPPKMPPSPLISVHTVGCAWRLLMCYVNTLPKRPTGERLCVPLPTPSRKPHHQALSMEHLAPFPPPPPVLAFLPLAHSEGESTEGN